MAVVALLASSARAGPVVKLGAVGGYDEAAPAHQEDGFLVAGGYRGGALTVTAEASYLDFAGSGAFAGAANRVGAVGQLRVVSARRDANRPPPHLDLDVGAGYRWLHWQIASTHDNPLIDRSGLTREGAELVAGLSATFGVLHMSLHYVLFDPRSPPPYICRGTCTQPPSSSSSSLLFEASFVFGD